MNLFYMSPKTIERNIHTEDDYRRLHYAMYRCSPDDYCDLNERRKRVASEYKTKVVPCGKYFILTGVAAFEVLYAFYYSMSCVDELSDELRAYYLKRMDQVKEKHERSQSLPFGIDLTEGQLATDESMELYVTEAVCFGLIEAEDSRSESSPSESPRMRSLL